VGMFTAFFLITASFGYFKTLKPSGFMKEPANYCQVCNLNLKYFAGWESVQVPQKFFFLGWSRGASVSNFGLCQL
jgi:hypothetical protein